MEELSKLQIETLKKLAKAPLPSREVRHSTWKSLIKRELIQGPDALGHIRITQAGRDAIKAS